MRGAESATEKATAAALKPTNGENEPPKILNTIPDNGAKEVPVDSLVTATFNESISSATINTNTFTVTVKISEQPNIKPGTSIKGIVTLGPDAKNAIFDSVEDLLLSTEYVAAIDIGAKDLAGNALVSAKQWSFSTKK